MTDLENKKLIKETFENKECIYKESGRICQVQVKKIKINKWGVKFKLMYSSDLHASDGDEELEYNQVPEKQNKTFIFSGSWELVSLRDNKLHVAYVNGTLNANPESLELFKNKETDINKIWYRKH